MRADCRGFTVIELMIVVAVIAILASIAIPKLMSARRAANEAAAIATLKGIAVAQSQCRVSTDIDTNLNGAGEFGYFAELSGLRPIRLSSGAPGTRMVDPKLLTVVEGGSVTLLGGTLTDAYAMRRSGYNFTMFLPSSTNDFVPEAKVGGATIAHNPDASLAEALWCCYAWPTNHLNTGKRVFFINQAGEVLAAQNVSPGTRYSGPKRGPNPNAAYSVSVATAKLSSTIATNTSGKDNQYWVIVN